jgi:integrase
MRIALTDFAVKNLSPPERGQRTYLDRMIPGFGVRVSQGGTKTFTLMHGPHRKLTKLGRYPIVSLAQARKKAQDILAAKQLGIYHEAPRMTFEDACAPFLKAYQAKNRPKTVYEMERILKRHLMPAFRRYPLVDISIQDVAAVIEKLYRTPVECFSTFVAARTIFRWFAKRKLIKASPLADLDPPTPPSSRDRVLTDAELAEVYRKAIADGSTFGAIVQLLIITGQRKNQIASIKREYIDTDAALVTWPAEVMKKRPHTIPLTPNAKTLVLAGEVEAYLFRARGKETPFCGFSTAKEQFDRKLEGVGPWRLNDLRRTFSTGLARLGVPPHLKELLLSHMTAKNPVEAIYDRYRYLNEQLDALLRWEAHLQALLASPTQDRREGRQQAA